MNETRIMMVARTESDRSEAANLMKRVSSAMSVVLTFSDKMADLDEDDADLANQCAPLIERLMLTLMSIYPDQRQMMADIKSFGDFTVRTI